MDDAMAMVAHVWNVSLSLSLMQLFRIHTAYRANLAAHSRIRSDSPSVQPVASRLYSKAMSSGRGRLGNACLVMAHTPQPH